MHLKKISSLLWFLINIIILNRNILHKLFVHVYCPCNAQGFAISKVILAFLKNRFISFLCDFLNLWWIIASPKLRITNTYFIIKHYKSRKYMYMWKNLIFNKWQMKPNNFIKLNSSLCTSFLIKHLETRNEESVFKESSWQNLKRNIPRNKYDILSAFTLSPPRR